MSIMRTTITLDDDVSIFLSQFQAKSHQSFKETVNFLLRGGIKNIQKQEASPPNPVLVRTFSVGKVLNLSDCPSNLMDQQDSEGL